MLVPLEGLLMTVTQGAVVEMSLVRVRAGGTVSAKGTCVRTTVGRVTNGRLLVRSCDM